MLVVWQFNVSTVSSPKVFFIASSSRLMNIRFFHKQLINKFWLFPVEISFFSYQITLIKSHFLGANVVICIALSSTIIENY